MPLTAIPSRRLLSQGLAGGLAPDPVAAVARLGMVQAQDYLGALWAVGLRTADATEAVVEQVVNDRRLIRTWPARGTLHFTAAADVRWLLALLAPRAMAGSAGRLRQLALDEDAVRVSRRLVTRALQGGRALTRAELYAVLAAGGVSPAGQRGIHILGRLAQEGLICLGARAGKQPTFVLLDEWAPAAPVWPREQALAELARRYISGHGPATAADFAWWSGLTVTEAKAGLEAARPAVQPVAGAGQVYWRLPEAAPAARAPSGVWLLPAFDEYLVGYKDRDAVLDPAQVKRINAGGGMLNPVIVVNGRVAGTWKRALRRAAVAIQPDWFAPPTAAQTRALKAAGRRYGQYLGLAAHIADAPLGKELDDDLI